MKKQFGLLAIFLLVLSILPFPAFANHGHHDTVTYVIDRVKVDGMTATNSNRIDVERDTTAYVEVFFHGEADGCTECDYGEIEDVKVKAWINGYDDDIEDSTSKFDIEESISYRKVLRLDIPDDMDANEDYTLHIEISDKDNSVEKEYNLRIQEQDKYIVIRDVIFNPGLNVDAGETLLTSVRVENQGDDKERDVKVMVSVPSLGIQTATYIDDLITQWEDDRRDDDDGDDKDNFNSAESTEWMGMEIPDNAIAGDYDLFVEVEYDRGRKTVEEMYTLTVSGGISSNLVVSVVDSQKTVAPGNGVAYQVSLTNLGNTATFNFDVEGVSSWGSARVDPSTLRISEDGTADVFVYVTPNNNAPVGGKEFNLVVKSGDNTVKTVPLVANVQTGIGAATSFRQGLEIGFAILLVILVILGIIIAAKRLGKDSSVEEPLLEEDQTYY